ncbi:hypothetical protein [Brumimicrobium aurantiacum]|uniref:Thymidylate kinase-like domain-containing protein n=1 Tax=Brumimicrobium aurantiacum TaxID=1737063 RepID=A0A3E1EZP9_9FLAO|nr:hypothetical protein [Brumimicrobium aurantiacum]RFC55040.1 hypothetical protein DXU93_04260 [Brumimicrobium aurantiacum]
MNKDLAKIGLHIGKTSKQSMVLYFINNPDGSPRWIWNAKNKRPDFLRFYNVSSFKSKIFSLMIKLIFLTRLQHLIFGKHSIKAYRDEAHCLSEFTKGDFALFTGTTGPNRKLVLFAQDQFIKVGLTILSIQALENELFNLKNITTNSAVEVPKCKKISDGIISFSDIGKNGKRSNTFSKTHAQGLHELYKQHPTTIKTFGQSEIFQESINQLHKYKLEANKIEMNNIIDKLELLVNDLAQIELRFNWNHRDFTPWNCYASKNQVKIYDFELAHSALPFGFDAFHYVMQQGIMVDRSSWSDLKPLLASAFQDLKSVFGNGNEKFEDHLKAYLLVNIAYHIDLYSRQEKWHQQIYWLLNTWNEALSDLIQNETNSRGLVIGDVFDFLQNEEYAAVKFPDIQPKTLSENSDIDLLVYKATSQRLIQYIEGHALVKKVNQKAQSNMTRLLIVLQNDQILALDLIWKLKVKALEFMSVQQAITAAQTNVYGVKKLFLKDHLNYLNCFYGLNNSSIPEKYQSDFDSNQEIVTETQELKQKIKNLPQNKGISRLINKVNYFTDTLGQFVFQKGLIITFSGVDGAGKSTIIENTKKELEKKLRKKVVVIRHRPSLLPILSAYTHGKEKAEKIAATTLPRQGKNSSFLSSLIRFSYYYTDYFFGQFYVYVKHVMRGEIVLYDRYYFDFINDSLRSNILLPKWLTKAGYKLLLKPNLNFFLYADAATILKRKKELDEKAINSLTKDYFNLFTELDKKSKGKYFLIENLHLQETMSFIASKTNPQIL